MRRLARFLVPLAIVGSIITIAPPAMAARPSFGGTGSCLEGNDLVYTVEIFAAPVPSGPNPPSSIPSIKLVGIVVSNPCDSALIVGLSPTGSESSIDIAVPSGVTAVVGAEQLMSAGLWLLELGAVTSTLTPGFGPCDYEPDFVVQSDGTLLSAIAVCT
jgi:hypothetical protein